MYGDIWRYGTSTAEIVTRPAEIIRSPAEMIRSPAEITIDHRGRLPAEIIVSHRGHYIEDRQRSTRSASPTAAHYDERPSSAVDYCESIADGLIGIAGRPCDLRPCLIGVGLIRSGMPPVGLTNANGEMVEYLSNGAAGWSVSSLGMALGVCGEDRVDPSIGYAGYEVKVAVGHRNHIGSVRWRSVGDRVEVKRRGRRPIRCPRRAVGPPC